jgi:hypothetical protein
VTADDPTTWRRSSACLPTDCVEVASHAHEVWIRDSADPWGPVLRITGAAWRSFISRIMAEGGIAARHNVEDGNPGV